MLITNADGMIQSRKIWIAERFSR